MFALMQNAHLQKYRNNPRFSYDVALFFLKNVISLFYSAIMKSVVVG